jgi:formate/nitrite transporter FocA (FNT family)
VLGGNQIGAFVFAAIASWTPMVEPTLRPALHELAETATSGGFLLVAYRAIYAGWLIALMAWLIASTRAPGAQVVLVWLTTAPIAAPGFRHSIAGSVEAFYRAFEGAATWGRHVAAFHRASRCGEHRRRRLLVALLNHEQVQRPAQPRTATRETAVAVSSQGGAGLARPRITANTSIECKSY